MKKFPLVSVMILNWNGEEVIEECIDSVLQTEYENYEIVVVDNASTDRSIEIIEGFKSVRLVRNQQNYGFAKGNNIGFAYCRGAYVVTLNNDIIVEPNWLNKPIEIFERDERIGIVSCRQMNYYKRDLIDSLYLFPTHFLLFGNMGLKKRYCRENPHYSKRGYTIGASGASVIYRKKLLEELNGFEEKFFAYHEESDLHMRAFLAGWKCLYIPTSVVYHKGSHSFNKMKKTFYYYHERNRVWFIYRNFPVSIIVRNLPMILFREFKTFVNVALIKRHMHTYVKARIDGFNTLRQFKDVRSINIKRFSLHRKRYNMLTKRKILPF